MRLSTIRKDSVNSIQTTLDSRFYTLKRVIGFGVVEQFLFRRLPLRVFVGRGFFGVF